MPESKPVQATIVEKLDATLQRIVTEGQTPRAIYLTPSDYDDLAAVHTAAWHETSGSAAYCWPCSYWNVPIIGDKLIELVEVPVRKSWNGIRRSTVYSATGMPFPIELP